MVYNNHMSTPTLKLQAQRITSTSIGGGYVLSAFRPFKPTLKAFKDVEDTIATIDLSDETGDWSNGRSFQIVEVIISDDERAMTVLLQD